MVESFSQWVEGQTPSGAGPAGGPRERARQLKPAGGAFFQETEERFHQFRDTRRRLILAARERIKAELSLCERLVNELVTVDRGNPQIVEQFLGDSRQLLSLLKRVGTP